MNNVEITIKVNGKLADNAVVYLDDSVVERIDKVRAALMAEVGGMNFARIQNFLEWNI